LRRLANNTFSNLANSTLQILKLTGCEHLVRIDVCMLCPLRYLTSLNMQKTKSVVPLDSLLAAFYAFQINGQVVELVNADGFVEPTAPSNVGTHLTGLNMRYVHETCVRELVLSQNFIVAITRRALSVPGSAFTRCLQRLDLSANAIFAADATLYFSLGQFPHLRSLEIHSQRIFNLVEAMPVIQNDGDRDFQRLDFPVTVVLAPKLEFLNFSSLFYLTGPLPPVLVFESATNLRVANISYNRIIGCTTVFRGLENLEWFDISGSDCYDMSVTFLDPFPRLKFLKMQKVTFPKEFINKNGSRLLYNLTNLKTLDLSRNDFGPSLPSDLFSRQQGLQNLILAGGNLETFDLDLRYHENLTILDLSSNGLSELSVAMRQALDYLAARQTVPLQLRLKGNPIACTCATLDFVRWLSETRVRLDEGGDYACVTDSGQVSSTGAVGRQWMNTWRRCVGATALWSASGLMLLLLSTTGAVWGVSKNITRILFFMSVLRKIRMPRRIEFRRDAYVAYCDADADLVCGIMQRELATWRGVSLLIRGLPEDATDTRFWELPGDNIALNMLEHIELCWKVILVLTQAFTEDDLAGFTARAVLLSVKDRMPRRVLLLCVGVTEVPRLASLQALLETVPESQVFFMPQPKRRSQHNRQVWDNIARIIRE
jgi:hypothetical protein